MENQCGSDDEGEEEFDYEKENKNVNCSPSSLYRQGKSSSPKILEENESEEDVRQKQAKKKKAGRRSTWREDTVDDLIDVVCNNEYSRKKLNTLY